MRGNLRLRDAKHKKPEVDVKITGMEWSPNEAAEYHPFHGELDATSERG